MFGSTLIGQTLAWHAIPDPVGAWAYSVGEESLAELCWSRSEGLVRAEVDGELWRTAFAGALPVQGVLRDTEGAARAVYAGSLVRGLIQMREGCGFALYHELDREHGPWIGIDDAGGAAVLRLLGRLGGGQVWFEVQVSSDPQFRRVVGPLLVLWGSLNLLRSRRPWLHLISSGVSEKAVRAALERAVLSVSF